MNPIVDPSISPTSDPTVTPTRVPSGSPVREPTSVPTLADTVNPIVSSVITTTSLPTTFPTAAPDMNVTMTTMLEEEEETEYLRHAKPIGIICGSLAAIACIVGGIVLIRKQRRKQYLRSVFGDQNEDSEVHMADYNPVNANDDMTDTHDESMNLIEDIDRGWSGHSKS